MQERTDWHVDAHHKPFLESFCKRALSDITSSSDFSGFVNDRLYFHLDHWGNGHVPPSKEVISNALRVFSDKTTNMENLDNLHVVFSHSCETPTN
ncbi:MAG: hypothetical protein ACRD3W_19500 [Terriglobales bacterium]